MRIKDGIVIWTVYFDRKLAKKRGRKLPRNKAVNKPTLTELKEAIQKCGYEIIEIKEARYPSCWWIEAGYIIIRRPPDQKKSEVIDRIGYEIRRRRGG